MDATLKKICTLLDTDDRELQCAAARILGELQLNNRDVLTHLARHLEAANPMVRQYVLSALLQLARKEVLPLLHPLLKKRGAERQKAMEIFIAVGHPAVTEIKKSFSPADARTRSAYITILAAIDSPAARNFLVECLDGAGAEVSKRICLALKESIGRMDAGGKKSFLKKVDAFLATHDASVTATTSGIMLLGFCADTSSIKTLLRYTQPDQPRQVRKFALSALSGIAIPSKKKPEVVKTLVPMLNEEDYPVIVRNVLTVLKGISLPKRLLTQLEGLLENPHATVRSFALARLGVANPHDNVKRLLSHLNSSDLQVRRAAQEALAKIPAARTHILRELESTKKYETGMRLVSILRGHRKQVTLSEKQRLFARMMECRANNDSNYQIFAAALKLVAPDYLRKKVLSHAKRLKSSGNYREALEQLTILSRHLLMDEAAEYEQAILSFILALPGTTSPSAKRTKECALLCDVIKKGNGEVLQRMKRDKALDPASLYAIAMMLSTGLAELREASLNLFRYLKKKAPKSGVGINAAQKLREMKGQDEVVKT